MIAEAERDSAPCRRPLLHATVKKATNPRPSRNELPGSGVTFGSVVKEYPFALGVAKKAGSDAHGPDAQV